MILSIVIPVWNKSNFTKTCLKDLVQLPEDHEIIVIDNGSADNTPAVVREYSRVIYHNNVDNLGFAKACNIGYDLATADNVLFLNNDIKVRSNFNNWTQVLIDNCRDYLVGPTMGQLDNQLNFIQEANKELSGNSYMSGWCLASSKINFNKLDLSRPIRGGSQIFSEEYGKAYFEDTDLSFRAKKLNIPFKVVDIPVVHFGKQSSSQLNTYKLYSEAKKIFIKKWGSKQII